MASMRQSSGMQGSPPDLFVLHSEAEGAVTELLQGSVSNPLYSELSPQGLYKANGTCIAITQDYVYIVYHNISII